MQAAPLSHAGCARLGSARPCDPSSPRPLVPVAPQAASLLGLVARRSEERGDELASALARVQRSLAAALFDAAPPTQYGERKGGPVLSLY